MFVMFSYVNVCYGTMNVEQDLRRKWTSGFSCTVENIGLDCFMNLCLLESLSKCITGLGVSVDLGWSESSKKGWWKLDVPCLDCQKHVTFKSVIICTNYGMTRGYSQRCRGAWCSDFFVAHELDRFETAVPHDSMVHHWTRSKTRFVLEKLALATISDVLFSVLRDRASISGRVF